ncbi:MAG: urease accessory protein UreG, partial [Rhodospirillales bacterium]
TPRTPLREITTPPRPPPGGARRAVRARAARTMPGARPFQFTNLLKLDGLDAVERSGVVTGGLADRPLPA